MTLPFTAAAAFAIALPLAAAAQEMSYGEAEYQNSCAVCHGLEGQGNGTLADELIKRPADLTALAKKNGGEFPSGGSIRSSTDASSFRAMGSATCRYGDGSSSRMTCRSMERGRRDSH